VALDRSLLAKAAAKRIFAPYVWAVIVRSEVRLRLLYASTTSPLIPMLYYSVPAWFGTFDVTTASIENMWVVSAKLDCIVDILPQKDIHLLRVIGECHHTI
jgi:hypothetical protein